MSLRAIAYDLFIGRYVEAYWKIQREHEGEEGSHPFEWDWFPAKVVQIRYVVTPDSESLRATIQYDSSPEFDEVTTTVTILSNSEFREDDSGETLSWRIKDDDRGSSIGANEDSFEEEASSDKDYAPNNTGTNLRQEDRHMRTFDNTAQWRKELGKSRVVEQERYSDALRRKMDDLERKIMEHESLLRACNKSSVADSLLSHLPAQVVHLTSLQFLASRMVDVIQRPPPPPSRSSASLKTASQTLMRQNWFETQAECTLKEFDQIRDMAFQEYREDVTFRPEYEAFPNSIEQEYKIIFADFKTLLRILGASSHAVEKHLMKVRYDRVKHQDRQQPGSPQEGKIPVAIDFFGCLLHNPERETNPTYVTIGEIFRTLNGQVSQLIGRTDSSWSHVEGSYVQNLRVAEVQGSEIQAIYSSWGQSTKRKIPFSLQWKALERQLLKPTNFFSNPTRSVVLGSILVQIPMVSIRNRKECRQFMDAYDEIQRLRGMN